MVVLPLGMDIVYFANLWCKFQCQAWIAFFSFLALLTVGLLSTGNRGREIPPPTGISSYWVSQFLFLSINW